MEKFYGDQDYYWSESSEPGIEVLQLLQSLDYSTAAIVVDRNVSTDWLSPDLAGPRTFIEEWDGGENTKSLSELARFVNAHERSLDKNSVVVIVGGGSTLDLVGLSCGLMYRGIRYIAVPTSLIAIADAVYGGKTAVNFGAKNQIGMYHEPRMIYVNPVFLRTLPKVHLNSGMIEIVKLGIFFPEVRQFLAEVKKGLKSVPGAALLAAKLKLDLLERDPLEETEASVLLYGHPFANAFETFAAEQRAHYMPHGEAVAIGIVFSAWLTDRLLGGGKQAIKEFELVRDWVDPIPSVRTLTPRGAEDFVSYLLRDKYASGDTLQVPGILNQVGYTSLPLKLIAEEYEEWRGWLLSHQPSLGPGTSNM
jgi:3-dehydroquinate synthase